MGRLMSISRGPLIAASAALFMTACATGGALEPGDETALYVGAGETIDIDDAKADSASELRVRAEGLSIWIRPLIQARAIDGVEHLVIRGRASRNLASVFSFVPDDPLGVATLVGRRSFEVALSEEEASSLVSGLPIFVSFEAPGAPHRVYVARIRGRVRLAQLAGVPEIRIESSMTSVVAGTALVYRGRGMMGNGIAELGLGSLSAYVGDADIDVAYDDPHRFRFEMTYEQIADANIRHSPIAFMAHARGGATAAHASARFSIVVSGIAATHLDPYEAWPPAECDSAVLDCLRVLDGVEDTDLCGDAFAVGRCNVHLDRAQTPAARFVIDLREHLEVWYARHAEDVAISGGQDLATAQAAVTAARVTEITDSEDDPLGHDLERVWVLSHPDVVFPGSDRVWIGAYDRNTEARVALTDFE